MDYDPSLPLGTFKKVDMGSDRHLILQSPSDPNAYLKVDQETFFRNLLATTAVHDKAMMVASPLGSASQTRVKGLPDSIDSSKPPKNLLRCNAEGRLSGMGRGAGIQTARGI